MLINRLYASHCHLLLSTDLYYYYSQWAIIRLSGVRIQRYKGSEFARVAFFFSSFLSRTHFHSFLLLPFAADFFAASIKPTFPLYALAFFYFFFFFINILFLKKSFVSPQLLGRNLKKWHFASRLWITLVLAMMSTPREVSNNKILVVSFSMLIYISYVLWCIF